LEIRFKELGEILVDELNEDGFWTGELSSSALGVAVSVAALHFHNSKENRKEIQRGLNWLKHNMNSDGSYGDTPESPGNISTSLLVFAAIHLYSSNDEALQQLETNIASYLMLSGIDIHSDKIADAILAHYKKDYTFSVPILSMCALCGIPEKHAFRKIPQLPFELALIPRSFYRLLNLSVVSYAIPALIAVGIVIFKKKKAGRLARWIRRGAEKKALHILEKSMPESGGFLEAIPLTAFVALSLVNAEQKSSKVVVKGIAFLKRTQRPDGGWPIDVDLSTWVSTLSIKALGSKKEEILSEAQQTKITDHLKSVQIKTVHPFNGTSPGGWGWTNYSGSVPDCDDTPGAILALLSLDKPENVKTEIIHGAMWLLRLQNKDGGFPTFSRGWGKLPFDQSCADLTGHAFLASATILNIYNEEIPGSQKRQLQKSLFKALAYLQKHQRKNGSWSALWFGNQHTPDHENPVYGTARILCYLNDALPYLDEKYNLFQRAQSMIASGERFLVDVQNSNGSWGGDKNVSGTIEETSLAISALQKNEFGALRDHGFVWLDQYFETHGLIPSPIGLYFASLWYDEKMYPLTAYLEALRRCIR